TEAPPPSDAPSASAPPAVLAAEPGAGPPAALVAGGASGSVLFLLAAAAFVVVLMRRSLRRRRLTLGDPDEQIAGAWYEFTDALRLDGRPVPAHLAATEAAAFAAAPPAPSGVSRRSLLRRAAPAEASPPHEIRPDGTRPDGTAPLDDARADVTRSGGRSPAGAPMPPLDELVAAVNTTAFAPGAADAAQAERAGAQAVAYADALRERRTWWRRAWWSIHPGPLRWHRPPSEPGERRIAPQRGRSPSRPPA
ncbi:MAG TPA: hypothetical protein VG370_00630, partial [Chloroflexota bacterium]|nr:hypothetical protein [Chloroflexota bacterium]